VTILTNDKTTTTTMIKIYKKRTTDKRTKMASNQQNDKTHRKVWMKN